MALFIELSIVEKLKSMHCIICNLFSKFLVLSYEYNNVLSERNTMFKLENSLRI